jgi:bacteriorhodopsin
LVTAIATYHYVRILNSWVDAFPAVQSKGTGDYVVSLTGAQFIDIYRYVGWLQKVPWLLIELILVMKLPRGVTVSKGLIVITGLVTAIATYHCVRILNSWVDAIPAVQSKETRFFVSDSLFFGK